MNEFNLLRYSSRISIGDEVLVQENDQMVPATVINVTMFQMQGEYLSVISISSRHFISSFLKMRVLIFHYQGRRVEKIYALF